jgi:hypothetical protein
VSGSNLSSEKKEKNDNEQEKRRIGMTMSKRKEGYE